ncbi:ATP-binding protein [Hymenobacter sediminicola]|uniref:histidine kinase n=1 Tax=Hymenobacter sediminicola TaxID=2761579 RepID=A0A7G7W6C7_9BACT|nr:ATP-binding protein [Hymenobacter sediminicola]QNH61920.1 PAS domain-containing protein [Hymenobacter sediminicola]
MPATPASPSAELSASDGLLQTLLDVSLTGIILFRPVYSPAGNGEIIDLDYVRLNLAAQRMLQKPEYPATTFLTLYPNAEEAHIFSFYRDTFLTGKAGYHEAYYHYDGLDNYFHLSAQRSGELLVVSFTDTADHERSAVENALHESKVREQAARAEAELQRQQLYSVFEQAPAMICIFDGPQHVFQFVNPPYQALVGERPLLGMPIAEAMPELEGQPIFGLLDQVYQTGETFYAHEMLVQLDHANAAPQNLEKRYYNFIYQARHSLQGSIDGILVFAYDVTPQVQNRQQIQTLNEELAAANEELHASNEEFLGSNAELQQTQQLLQQLNQQLEMRVLERTQQVENALHEARQQREQLRMQKSLLQQILGQTPAAIATLSGPDHRFTFFNAQYQTLTSGRTQLGHTVADVLPEVVEQGFVDLLDNVYLTGESFEGVEMPALLYNSATGQNEPRFVDFVYQPLIDEEGQTHGILAFILDSTEKVHARQQVQALNEELAVINEELQATNEELQVTNEELGDTNNLLSRTNVDLDTFIYTASHDLKAPITNIEGLLHTLLDELPAASRQGDVPYILDLMHGSVDRFKRTIEHLTDISKLQQEHAQPATLVQLATVVEDVRLDLAPLLRETGAQLEVAVTSCPMVSFSEKNLRSVIYNLLSNALKYQHPLRAPRIRVRCQHTEAYLVLSVQDNGLGLNEQQQQNLFGMFQRFHTHVDGSGVGLYMVKKMVENVGGYISVESQENVGSTFFVYFPR